MKKEEIKNIVDVIKEFLSIKNKIDSISDFSLEAVILKKLINQSVNNSGVISNCMCKTMDEVKSIQDFCENTGMIVIVDKINHPIYNYNLTIKV